MDLNESQMNLNGTFNASIYVHLDTYSISFNSFQNMRKSSKKGDESKNKQTEKFIIHDSFLLAYICVHLPSEFGMRSE